MSTLQVLSPDFSNWEVVAFCLIRGLIVDNNLSFSRSELISDTNLNAASKFLSIFGHKKFPQHPEETLQKTIQNLRDKGHILFLGNGEYKLTKKGLSVVSDLKIEFVEAFNSIKKL